MWIQVVSIELQKDLKAFEWSSVGFESIRSVPGVVRKDGSMGIDKKKQKLEEVLVLMGFRKIQGVWGCFKGTSKGFDDTLEGYRKVPGGLR